MKTSEAAVTGRFEEVNHVVGNFIAEAVLGHSDTDDHTAKLRTKMRAVQTKAGEVTVTLAVWSVMRD